MITINIDEVRQKAEAKKSHKPKIRIIIPEVIKEAEETVNEDIGKRVDEGVRSERTAAGLKDALLIDLDNQERDLRIERAKLSNQYLPMIKKEATMEELAHHYRKIEAISDEIRDVYNKREHVLKFGRLPGQETANDKIDHTNVLALKEQRRSLNDRISKTRKKIEKGKATNSPRLAEWELYVDQMEAERSIVQSRIKELSNE